MIPKKIHYCWFGRGEKSKLMERCIASWKRFCPDYEIIEWNEDNFDVTQYPYASYCLREKKYAFLSDFVRLAVVYQQGGFYFDTDVELLKKPDELLRYDAFYGFENNSKVNTGQGFGAVAGHSTLQAMLAQYDTLVPDTDGIFQPVGCPILNTNALIPLGLQCNGKRQNVAGAEILPADYMNPYDDPTGRMNKTENTISVHWYAKSALSKKQILKSKLTKPFHRLFGVQCFDWLKRIPQEGE